MPDRKMFWRIVRRLFAAQRGRLLVILLALGAGAALTAALLNLEVDAKSRLSREFRAFGTNVIVAPREQAGTSVTPATLDESIAKQVREFPAPPNSSATSNLYFVADVASAASQSPVKTVIAGSRVEIKGPTQTFGVVRALNGDEFAQNQRLGLVGFRAAQQLHLQSGDQLRLQYSGREEVCRASLLPARGDEIDSQIGIDLESAQRLAGQPGKISLVRLSVAGTPREIRAYIAALAQKIPSADVHGLRQFTDAEAKIYNRISGLLTATNRAGPGSHHVVRNGRDEQRGHGAQE